jgi:hypothetical protein
MPDLPDPLKIYVAELVERQQTGQYQALMGYTPSRGKHVHLKPIENGGEKATACEGITRTDLRKLEAAGLISINTPRSTWAVKLRPAAYGLSDK